MNYSLTTISRVACVILACLLPGSVRAAGQELPRAGMVASIGITSMTSTGATGSTAGVRAGLLSLRPGGIGFDFGLAWLAPSSTSDVFRRYGAVASDLGLAFRVNESATRLVLGAGGSFLLNGNGSGEAAPHLKLGVLRAFSDRVGIRADLVGRYWFHGPGPGAGVDVGLLWLHSSSAPLSTTSSTDDPSFDGWTVGATASLLARAQQDWDLSFWGPTVTLARVRPRGVGFETALSFIVPTGFYNFTGASLDLGLVYGMPAGSSSMLLLRAGATALVGGDSDGTGGGSGALYPGVGLLQRIAGPLALRADVTPRIWITENTSITFGGSLGLVLAR